MRFDTKFASDSTEDLRSLKWLLKSSSLCVGTVTSAYPSILACLLQGGKYRAQSRILFAKLNRARSCNRTILASSIHLFSFFFFVTELNLPDGFP